MARQRLGVRRALHYKAPASVSTPPDLMSGADGDLTINGTASYVTAGSIKRYNNLTIINGGALVITGFYHTGGGSGSYPTNDGRLPTIIGVAGTCTIDSTSSIDATDNAGKEDHYYEDQTYTATTVPYDCAVAVVSYVRYGGIGGAGGESGGSGAIFGYDLYPTGHGGGGAGATDGGETSDAFPWGQAGYGGASGTYGITNGYSPYDYGFSVNGAIGVGGEVISGPSFGGGGAGGVRGLSGGAVLLQVNVAAITGVINIFGADAGNGGNGGVANSGDDESYGGGPGGGGAGGSGGYFWGRYKSGTFTPSINDSGGLGGLAGTPGSASNPGYDGTPGADGETGGYSIATY